MWRLAARLLLLFSHVSHVLALPRDVSSARLQLEVTEERLAADVRLQIQPSAAAGFTHGEGPAPRGAEAGAIHNVAPAEAGTIQNEAPAPHVANAVKDDREFSPLTIVTYVTIVVAVVVFLVDLALPYEFGCVPRTDCETACWSRQTAALFVASLFQVPFRLYLPMPVLFLPEAAANKGVSAGWVGFIFAAYSFVIPFATPLVPTMLQSIPAPSVLRRSLLVFGACTMAMGLTIFLGSAITFIAWTSLLRAGEGAASAVCETAAMAAVFGVFPAERLGVATSFLQVPRSLAQTAGPYVGAELYIAGGYELPFYALGFVFTVVALVLCTLLRHMLPASEYVKKPTNVSSLLRIPAVWAACLTVTLSYTNITFLDPLWEPMLVEAPFSLSTEVVGGLLTIRTGGAALIALFAGQLAMKIGYITQLAIGAIAYAAAMVLVGQSQGSVSVALIAAALALIAVGQAVVAPCVPVLMARACAEEGFSKAEASPSIAAVYVVSIAVGSIVGSTMGGILKDTLGLSAATYLMAVAGLFTTLLCLPALWPYREPDPRSDSPPPPPAEGGEDEASSVKPPPEPRRTASKVSFLWPSAQTTDQKDA